MILHLLLATYLVVFSSLFNKSSFQELLQVRPDSQKRSVEKMEQVLKLFFTCWMPFLSPNQQRRCWMETNIFCN